MKSLPIIILMALSLPAMAKESCELADLKLSTESPLAERLYFTGTCHYRNKEYPHAVESWQELAKLESVGRDESELQVDVLNNLGYMLFFGYGVAEDKQEALAYWNKAIALGHTESEYHLCHAYADADESTYSPEKALRHCQKAEMIYRGMRKKDSDQKTILKQIEKYLKQLKRPG